MLLLAPEQHNESADSQVTNKDQRKGSDYLCDVLSLVKRQEIDKQEQCGVCVAHTVLCGFRAREG